MGKRNAPPADPDLELARSLCQQAAELHQQAEYAIARSLYERALVLLEGEPGPCPSDTARCLNGLGQVLMKQGEYDQARPLVERSLAIRKHVLGPTDPGTAESLQTLGELESDLGNFERGLSLVSQAFSVRRKALGEAHPDSLESRTIRALMLLHQGDAAGAEQLLLEARSLCEQNLGENHLTTARVLNGLGRVWAAEPASHVQARPMYRRALAIYEHLLGQTHPYTALALNNLAALLADMHDYEAALPLLERSLDLHERIYGPSSWRTSFVLVNLADVFSRQEGTADTPTVVRDLLERAPLVQSSAKSTPLVPSSAERALLVRDLLERALIIREQAWGARHPQTVACLRKLVAALGTLQRQGDEQALLDGPVLFPCLVALDRAGGSQDPAYHQMPGTFLDPDKAAQRLHNWITTRETERARPPLSAADQEQLEAARVLVQRADDELKAGDGPAAISLLEEALELRERVLGLHHLDQVEILQRLAKAQALAGHYSAIRPLTQRIVDIHLHTLGPGHPMTGMALTELLSQTASDFGPAAALPLQEQILHSMEEAIGPEDPMVGLARQSLQNFKDLMGDAALAAGQAPESQALPRSLSDRREEALAGVPRTGQDPLTGLDDVPWRDLHHAYGPASDVPNLLRMLTANDEEVRHSALEDLGGSLCHQGDVYEATAYAVPFLLQLLESPSIPGKYDLLAFLEAIANGGPWLTADHDWMEEVLTREGRDFQTEIEQAQGYVQAARAAVRDGLDTYLECLQDSSAFVRERAFALLCALPECGPVLFSEVLPKLEKEPDPATQAQMVHHLGYLLATPPASADPAPGMELLSRLLNTTGDRRVRFAAAVALVSLEGDGAPSKAAAVLEEAVLQPAGLRRGSSSRGAEPAYLVELTVEGACQALSRLSVARRIPLLVDLLERIEVPAHAHQVAVILLDSALLGRGRSLFLGGTPEVQDDVIYYARVHPTTDGTGNERIYPQAGQPRNPASLSPQAKEALRAVLRCRPVWQIRSNLLELYGLPRSRTRLRRLL